MIGAEVMLHYENSVEMQLILHCAPVLKGIKAGNTITLLISDLDKVSCVIKDTEVHTKTLYQNNSVAVVLFYRRDQMLKVMNQVAYCAYLLQLGYRPLNVEECFNQLRSKMYDYHNRRKVFPHELGVFLEYPLYDIQEFIRQGGKNCKLCGYWKVYDQEDDAKTIFKQYDQARNELLMNYQDTGKITI